LPISTRPKVHNWQTWRLHRGIEPTVSVEQALKQKGHYDLLILEGRRIRQSVRCVSLKPPT
jgi:hypothetical protein